MQVDAIYDNGMVKLPDQLQFKHERFRVRIEIPDDELVDTSKPMENKAPAAKEGDIRDQVRAILGLDFEQLAASASIETSKDIWHKHLEEKHLCGR